VAEMQKQRELEFTQNRLKKLSIDQERADKLMARTMRLNEYADSIRQRRDAERLFKE